MKPHLGALSALALSLGLIAWAGNFQTAAAQSRGPRANPAPAPAVAPATNVNPLAEFKTVETCKTTLIQANRRAGAEGVSGYLGLETVTTGNKLTVGDIAPESPAAKAGLRAGDLILNLDGHIPGDAEDFRDMIQAHAPGDKIVLSVTRATRPFSFNIILSAASRPMSLNTADQPALGVRVVEGGFEIGARITQVEQNSPAARSGLRVDDIITQVDGITLGDAVRLTDALAAKKINDTVSLIISRAGTTMQLQSQLVAASTLAGAGGPGGRGGRGGAAAGGGAGGGQTGYNNLGQLWRNETLRIGVIGIEYPDAKHNPAIAAKDWENALFSHGTYITTSITGQPVFGSMYDFYNEQSYGALKIQGSMLPWIQVVKNRMDYSQGSGTGGQDRALLTEALDLLTARNRTALDNVDGLLFLYAGNRVNTTRGGIYWPHKSVLNYGARRFPYVLFSEGAGGGGGPGGGRGGGGGGGGGGGPGRGSGTAPATQANVLATRMTDISVICHETGHILGLPDLYARPETPGSEGLGIWCTMSQQAGNGRPQQFCAWCKEQMGWLKPAIIDPTIKQKLILSPVEDSAHECYKVLVRPDGSEYFLLENRQKKGFDASLPAAGLLVWRVIGNRPVLEESHGVSGPAGPSAFLSEVPFPSMANDSFTPYTTPSSRGLLGGGLPVYITNIRRLPDGRITFYIGYEFD